MKLGVNSVVNLATKQIGVINMEGSDPKIHRPISKLAHLQKNDKKEQETEKKVSIHDSLKIGIITSTALVALIV